MNVGFYNFFCLFSQQQTQDFSTNMINDSLKDVMINSDVNENDEFFLARIKAKIFTLIVQGKRECVRIVNVIHIMIPEVVPLKAKAFTLIILEKRECVRFVIVIRIMILEIVHITITNKLLNLVVELC